MDRGDIVPTLFGLHVSRQDVEQMTGRLDQVAGVTPFEFADGRARHTRAVRLQAGDGLDIVALIDRNLDLAHAFYRGIPLCWRSPNGDAAPTYYDPRDAEWLRTFFGGLLTTCGLTNFGPGGTDAYGTVGLHGRINCLPAEDVRCFHEWDGDDCSFVVSGTTRQTRVFGENLSLERRLSTRLGSPSLWLEDTVTNHGFEPAPHMILYHCNGGFPILSRGARLHVSHRGMRPRDADAEKGLDVWDRVTSPEAGFKEQVFIHEPIACADGRAAVALVNDRIGDGEGLGLAIRFDPEQLPALFQWRMLGQGTYVMGMEPANCPTIEGRRAAAEQGTLPFLDSGETRRYGLEFRVLRNREEIDAMVRQIEEANAGNRE